FSLFLSILSLSFSVIYILHFQFSFAGRYSIITLSSNTHTRTLPFSLSGSSFHAHRNQLFSFCYHSNKFVIFVLPLLFSELYFLLYVIHVISFFIFFLVKSKYLHLSIHTPTHTYIQTYTHLN